MSDTWYYADQNKQIGPVDIQQLKASLTRLANAKDVLVWHPGFTDWKKAGDVPELTADISAAAPPPFGGPAVTTAPAGMNAGSQTDVLHLWFSFSGRINRAKYWLVSLCNMVIMLIAVGAGLIADATVAWLLVALIIAATTLSTYAAGAKRLHDRDKSGWWVLVYYILPSIISALGGQTGSSIVITGLISFAILLAGFIDLGCLKGTTGNNRFGPDPLAGRH